MKRFINYFIIITVTIICLTSCEKHYYYIVEGRLIDKTTKEAIKDIMVSFYKYDLIPSKGERNVQKMSPIENYCWSDEDGRFCTVATYSTSLLYIYGYSSNENGLYKDTVLLIDFSNVPLSGTPSNNYKGDYVLSIGDIELEKTN